MLPQVSLEALQQLVAEILARHFAAPELDGGLDLVPFAQEADGVLELEVVVVLVDVGPELDLFDVDDLLLLLRLVGLLLLLVEELAEVHDAADRRLGRRGHLHQVEGLLLSPPQRLLHWHDAGLRAVGVDQAYLTNPDTLVDPRCLVDVSSPPESVELAPVNWFSDRISLS